MIEKSIYYKNAAKGIVLEVLLRAGEDVYPHCYPNADLSSIDDYSEIEAVFYRWQDLKRGEPIELQVADSALDKLFTYKHSFVGRVISVPNIPNSDHVSKEEGKFDELFKTYGYKRIPEETSTVNVEEKNEHDGTWCRACGNYNDYAVPDKVIDDGKNTCWACAEHPERRRRGLNTPEQVALVLKLNKIHT